MIAPRRLGVVAGLGLAAALLALAPSLLADPGRSHRPVCSGPADDVAASCSAFVVTDAAGKPLASSGPAGYGPAQFHTAYGLPATAASAQTIGIVDAFDAPNVKRDLDTYNKAFGLPAFPSCSAGVTTACFQKVNQSGSQTSFPRKDAGWALEISLDVETAHAICQNCKILLVEATTNSFANLGAAEDMAAQLGANVISNSFGAPEFAGETAASIDGHFNHPGVAITASSGDSGFGVEYPAASQFVTAVGGTTLTLNPNGTRLSETAWSGAGSGCSAFVPKPSWQTDTACARRTVSDVAADADPATGAAVFDSTGFQGRSGWFTVGGTSLASPLVASVYALAGNASQLTAGSSPYSHAASLFDVTAGSNGVCGGSYLCTALGGFDGPTGLGTPIGLGAF